MKFLMAVRSRIFGVIFLTVTAVALGQFQGCDRHESNGQGILLPYPDVRSGFEKAYGYIQIDGKFAISPKFAFADFFSEGMSLVRYFNDNWAYIDMSGKSKILVGKQDQRPKAFSEGIAFIWKGSYMGIDTSGNEIFRGGYDDVEEFSEGFAAVSRGGLWGLINRQGKLVIDIKLTKLSSPNAGICIGSDENGFFLIEISKMKPYEKYEKFEWLGRFSDGLAPARNGGQVGYVNNLGSWVILDNWKEMSSFSSGFAVVKQVNELYSIINTKGTCMMDNLFFALPPENGYFAVFRDDKHIEIYDTDLHKLGAINISPGMWCRIRSGGVVEVSNTGFGAYYTVDGRLIRRFSHN